MEALYKDRFLSFPVKLKWTNPYNSFSTYEGCLKDLSVSEQNEVNGGFIFSKMGKLDYNGSHLLINKREQTFQVQLH